MKIAVTYDNGNVFQHFGKTENFKVYEVEDNKVVSSEVIGSNGTGHGALAGLLAEQGIDVLICGGIGGGAQNALAEAGVQLCSGAQGNTDEVVEALRVNWFQQEQPVTIITMRKVIPVAITKRDIPAEEPAVVDVVHTSRHLQART